MTSQPDNPATKSNRPIYIRLWPLYIIIGGLVLALSQGWQSHLTPTALAENAEYLNTLVSENFVTVLLAYVAIYILATTFMVPASALTIGGGFLFGLAVGAPATIMGATIGASILFLATKTSLGDILKERAGPFLGKMEAGFKSDALSYMFSMRLIPAVPFAVANIAPAIFGAKYRDYLLSTALGIIPGTVAYTWMGAALKGTLLDAAEAGQDLDAGALISSSAANFAPALIALGVVSVMPILYKKFFKKSRA